MGFSRQEYSSRLPFPSPGDLPDQGIKRRSPASAGRFFTSELPGKPEGRAKRNKNHVCPSDLLSLGSQIPWACHLFHQAPDHCCDNVNMNSQWNKLSKQESMYASKILLPKREWERDSNLQETLIIHDPVKRSGAKESYNLSCLAKITKRGRAPRLGFSCGQMWCPIMLQKVQFIHTAFSGIGTNVLLDLMSV